MRQEQVNFDTHKHVKNFEKAGFDIRQSESLVQVISASRDFDLSRLATKDQFISLEKDIKNLGENLRAEMKTNISELRTEMLDIKSELKGDIAELRTELKGDIASSHTLIKETSLSNLRWTITTIIAVLGGFMAFTYKVLGH